MLVTLALLTVVGKLAGAKVYPTVSAGVTMQWLLSNSGVSVGAKTHNAAQCDGDAANWSV